MKTVQKKLSRIQKRQNQSKIKNMLVLAGSSIAFAVITVFLLFSSDLVSGSKTFDFYEELTDITDLYYQEEFQNGSKADREKICEQADTGLRKLQKQCTEKEEHFKNISVNDSYKDLTLYNAINLLEDDLRTTTILFYFEDMKYKDIAKVLNVKEGTIKSRLSRAKEKLHNILKEELHG